MIKIHKEGFVILAVISILLAMAVIVTMIFLHDRLWISIPLCIVFFLILVFVMRFFRVPARRTTFDEKYFYSPADGKVVVIEKTIENEFLKEERIQVSIFMSVWDVHINFFPISGKVIYRKHHHGKYLIARNPKSSALNERVSVVIENKNKVQFLMRQIAGIIARRIINYATPGKTFKAGDQLGFIKFGSRVDIFFPVGTEILVKPGEQVTGSVTPVARIS